MGCTHCCVGVLFHKPTLKGVDRGEDCLVARAALDDAPDAEVWAVLAQWQLLDEREFSLAKLNDAGVVMEVLLWLRVESWLSSG
jgi:hypothetical protein